MRPQNINLAYAETIGTCLAVEHNQECLHNPRWIEEDWSEERVHVLQRERHAFERDAEFYSREQRLELSRRIIHGQVCLHHSHYCAERLHILQMIREDARSDLYETKPTRLRGGRVRTAAARAARKRALRAARFLTPEQGRPCPDDLMDELESGPPSLTNCSGASATATSTDVSEQRSDDRDMNTALHHVGNSSAGRPVTPQSSLERLMLLGHLLESEDRIRHLEHHAYISSDDIAGLRHQNSGLRAQNFQLKLEKVRQSQELIQTQVLLRNNAGEQFQSFLAAKNR